MNERQLNGKLGEIIRQMMAWGNDTLIVQEQGIFTSSAIEPDMFFNDPKYPPVVLEGKQQGKETQLETQADHRLRSGLVCASNHRSYKLYSAGEPLRVVVGVVYPHRAGNWQEANAIAEFLSAEDLRYKLFVCDAQHVPLPSFPVVGWIEGNVRDLVEFLLRSVVSAHDINTVTNIAVTEIGNAASRLNNKLASNKRQDLETIVKNLDGITAKRYVSDEELDAGIRVACVVLLDAMLMLDELNHVGVSDMHLDDCLDPNTQALDVRKLRKAFDLILKTNYKSVFQPAQDILIGSIQPSEYTTSLTALYNAAASIRLMKTGIASSVAGEIYAKVLETDQRKKTASYYTRPEVAEYLAWMTLPDKNELPEDSNSWRVADFACGTGTLLRAAYKRMRGFIDPADYTVFHENMMATGLCGLDISVIASHLTATSLVSLQPETSYGKTSVAKMDIGNISTRQNAKNIDEVRTGSLEIALQNTALFSTYTQAQQGQKDEQDGYEAPIDVTDRTFDAVIMNPPYSKSGGKNKLFDITGVSELDRKLTVKRCSKKIVPKGCGNLNAGLGSIYAAIADQKLKHGKRLGLVLPMTIAAGSSWGETREMIASGYEEVVVSYFADGSAGGDDSMSADTHMGELLITAKKLEKTAHNTGGGSSITYACFFKPFASPSEAVEMAKALQKTLADNPSGHSGDIFIGKDHVGDWGRQKIENDAPWVAAGSAKLHDFLASIPALIEGKIGNVTFPTTSIKDLFDKVGPSESDIGSVATSKQAGVLKLKAYDPKKATSYLSLWETDANAQICVTVSPTHYGSPHKNKTSQDAKTLYKNATTDLFFQQGMRFTSQKLAAAITAHPMLGGRAWAGLYHTDRNIKFAFAVWCNSIFGLATYWAQGGRQQQGRTNIRLTKSVENFKCPDFNDSEMKARATKLRQQKPHLLTTQLQQANQANTDPERRKLDIEAGKLLGLNVKEAQAISRNLADLWCAEPSVKN